MTKPILKTQSLTVGYGDSAVVDAINLEFLPGSITTLIGPNGSGKSTILKTVSKQLAPLCGTVLLDKRELRSYDEAALANTLAILSTKRVQPELMSCEDVVAMGRYPHTGRLGILKLQDRAQIASAMELVGIAELAAQPFSHLSDGQRQRAMIARAIAQEPSILVLDEPTSYLDISYKLELMKLIKRLADERKITVIMSLHELELAQYVSDTIVCVAGGHIERVGTPYDIFSDGYIRQLYEVDDDAFELVYPGLNRKKAAAISSEESVIRSGQTLLRRGVTTGSCAALAASGATRLLLSGVVPETICLRTPRGLPIEAEPCLIHSELDSATCGVRKDAGDDPDVTDGAVIVATVRRTEEGFAITGGEGIGVVTKPGLDQAPGEAAINSVPRAMIEQQARAVADELGYEGGLEICISIPGGERLAKRSFNEQLGIVGGLSILGTTGIEEPMSEQALVDTLEVELRQIRAEGADSVLLLPGNYASDFVENTLNGLSAIPKLRFANYLGEALDITVQLGFSKVLLVGHIGKLVKLAGGIMNTHSKIADCRMELLCAHAAACGANSKLCKAILDAATSDAALELLQEAGLKERIMSRLIDAMQSQLERRVRGALSVGVLVFSAQHGLLGTSAVAQSLLASWEERHEQSTRQEA